MAEFKIKTNITYETSDDREFDDLQEAQEWQQALEIINDVVMLTGDFIPTTMVDEAFFVNIKTQEELKAFELVREYEGLWAQVPDLGCWFYDDISDKYKNIDKEISRLQDMKEKILNAKK